MNRFAHLIALVLIGILSLSTSGQGTRSNSFPTSTQTGGQRISWTVLSLDAFTIEMPGRVVKQMRTLNTVLGPTPTVFYSAELRTESFSIMYQDFPQSQYDFNGAGLSGLRKGYLRLGGTITSEREISLGDYAGREIVFTDKDGFFYVSRAFSVEPRLYQIMYVTSRGARLSSNGIKFFKSFELNEDYARVSAERRVEYDSNKLANDLAEEFPYYSLNCTLD